VLNIFDDHFLFVGATMACAHELFGLFRLISAGLASLGGFSGHPLPQQDRHQAWQVLAPCAETVSFDGAWTLSLGEDGTAIVNSSRHEQRLQGRWDLLDAAGRAYRVDVLAFSTDLVVVPTAAGCLLGAGSLKSIDLRQSWFSRQQREAGDLVASVSHLTK
jgi:hypothetical protein